MIRPSATPATAVAVSATPPTGLGAALHEAVQRARPLPPWVTGRVTLCPQGEQPWTVLVRRGVPTLTARATRRPTTTIRGSAETLSALASGRESGVDAFLDGRITVRGNLALSLRVSAMLGTVGAGVAAGDVMAANVRTFYVEAGSGPPVILLHGLGATNASMLTTLRDLAPTYRVIAPDLPGFGDSGKPLRPLHAAFYARWLAGFCDALGLDRPSLVGNSMGGRVAVEAGLRAPHRVDRLVLLAPSPAFLRGRELVRLVRLLRPELALVPLPLPRAQVLRAVRGMFSRPSRLDAGWYDAAVDEFLRVFSTPAARVSFFSALRQIYLEEPHRRPGGFWGRLPQLQPPALFVWGERDRLVPARFAAHVQRALPAATSVILPDCGHVPQFERPEQTHALVRSFLAGDP